MGAPEIMLTKGFSVSPKLRKYPVQKPEAVRNAGLLVMTSSYLEKRWSRTIC